MSGSSKVPRSSPSSSGSGRIKFTCSLTDPHAGDNAFPGCKENKQTKSRSRRWAESLFPDTLKPERAGHSEAPRYRPLMKVNPHPSGAVGAASWFHGSAEGSKWYLNPANVQGRADSCFLIHTGRGWGMCKGSRALAHDLRALPSPFTPSQ